jgi:hypothetical protein
MSELRPDEPERRERTPLVEINVIHEHGPAPRRSKLTEAVEVWTRNHVYILDATLRCVEVRKAGADEVVESGFVGSRLVGGQLNTSDATELSYPFPRPGAVGVFEVEKGRARQFHHTSPVKRVVLRLSILTVTTNRVLPTWEEISNATRPPL